MHTEYEVRILEIDQDEIIAKLEKSYPPIITPIKGIKILSTKFSDLNYADMQLHSAHNIYSELSKKYSGNYNQDKIDKLLNPSVLEKEFNKLAKKNGLLFAKIPNFIANKDTNTTEFRFAYSKSQEAAMLETKSQMMALISKRLKDCGVRKEVAKELAEQWTGTTKGKPIMNAMNEAFVIQKTLCQHRLFAALNEVGGETVYAE